MQTSFRLSKISSDSGKNTLNKEKKLASLKLPRSLAEQDDRNVETIFLELLVL